MDQRFCDICRSITFVRLCLSEGYRDYSQAKLIRLQAELSNGCPLCSMLWAALYRRYYGAPPHLQDEDTVQLTLGDHPKFQRIEIHSGPPKFQLGLGRPWMGRSDLSAQYLKYRT